MITKRISFGSINILEDGQIQLRQDTVLEEDGKELSRTYHRKVLDPAQGHNETDSRLVAIINLVWTPEVIEARKEFIKNQSILGVNNG